MATASEILSAIAPQFDAIASRQTFLSLADARTSSSFFGSSRPEAVALRAAHGLQLATDTDRNGAGGPITDKKEGTLGISFGSGSSTDSDLSQTSFGCQLQGLMRARPAGRVTGTPYQLGTSYAGGYVPWV